VSLVIVDTGCANLSSVAFAFERLGASPRITAISDEIKSAQRVILPGVGSAPFALQNIAKKNLSATLKSLEQPVLGICLGMQLLFETVSEGGTKSDGLGLISGGVDLLDTGSLPSPHMGWNQLAFETDDPITSGLENGAYAYFVHSFAAPVSDATVASAQHGSKFSAIVRKGNVWGCQFHPERSSATGSKILENFLKVSV